MKMFVALIILILTSFLAPVKVTCRRGGGRSGGGRSGGFSRGFKHTPKPTVARSFKGMPKSGGGGGGGSGNAHVPVGGVCTQNVLPCVNTHIYGDYGPPKNSDYCCMQFKFSRLCLCRYQHSGVDWITTAANAVAQSCNILNTMCPASSGVEPGGGAVITRPDTGSYPNECRLDVRECVLTHIYENVKPTFRGPCCQKFKYSKLCVCKFQTSGIFNMSKGAYRVIRSCRFRRTGCPRIY